MAAPNKNRKQTRKFMIFLFEMVRLLFGKGVCELIFGSLIIFLIVWSNFFLNVKVS